MPEIKDGFCGSCEDECDFVHVDQGIGTYEFWGRKGTDVDLQWVSDCCEGTVYEDEELRIESDYPEPSNDY